MKFLTGLFGCVMLAIGFWATPGTFAAAGCIGSGAFLLFIAITGFFLTIRDNQIILHKAMLQALKERK